jgi:hypothetical protein
VLKPHNGPLLLGKDFTGGLKPTHLFYCPTVPGFFQSTFLTLDVTECQLTFSDRFSGLQGLVLRGRTEDEKFLIYDPGFYQRRHFSQGFHLILIK